MDTYGTVTERRHSLSLCRDVTRQYRDTNGTVIEGRYLSLYTDVSTKYRDANGTVIEGCCVLPMSGDVLTQQRDTNGIYRLTV